MDKRNYKICAVLVTFNRQDLLLKVLSSFKNQTIQISGIVLVNNCSTDNTEEKLIENSIIDKNSTSFDTLYESKWNDYSFYYSEKDSEYYYSIKMCHLPKRNLWNINTKRFNVGNNNNYFFNEFDGNIKYVHELQHVLKVVGIEKEVIV